MALPFLPGNSFNPALGKSKFHKSHHFDKCNEVAMMVGEAKPGIGGETLPFQKLPPANSSIPRGSGTDLPAWVAFDRQVLCFDAFFQEAVHEKREEQFRVRNCKIYFYLEDDSIQVIEPRAKNAGIPQGTLIRRHRIPRPPPNDATFYTVEDFNVGKDIVLYSRTFQLTACDQFTENFLGKLGVRVNNPHTNPEDPYMNHRKALDESMQPLRPYEKHDTLKQFLDHDRHVLRFYCYWDDTDRMFGDPRQLVLHYFLADDTIEIREIIPANAGRDAVPMFLRRAKVPKNVNPLYQPGVKTDRTVLNVFGPTGHGGRYILDSLKTGSVAEEFYIDSDLTIGASLNVWGRKVTLCDCDEFTREYYRTKYGMSDSTTIKYKADPVAKREREVPPYNGFGSEEDSLCSCMGLLPKPPKRDFIKFMEKDRHGLDSNVLRFLGRMDTTKPIDQDRRFIISYFLSDDTILVFEPPVRNSGIIGGKFLERGRIKKPGQEMFSTQLSQYYTAQDLAVGRLVEFNKFRFVLIDADEYAYRYMENHAREFPCSNIQAIMGKLCQAECNSKSDSCAGVVSFERFCEVINGCAPGLLNDHEIRTLARYYQDRKEDCTKIETLAAVAQEQLKKANFEGFAKIIEQCAHYDQTGSGCLEGEVLRTVISALKVPLQGDLLRAILLRTCDSGGKINYEQFVQLLNWRDCPMAPCVQPCTNAEDNWQGTKAANELNAVNVGQLMQDLCGSSGQSGGGQCC